MFFVYSYISGLNKMKQEDEDNHTVKSFIIHSLHPILVDWDESERLTYMGVTKNAYNILVRKCQGRRLLQRPSHRCKILGKECEGVKCIWLAQNRVQWQACVNIMPDKLVNSILPASPWWEDGFSLSWACKPLIHNLKEWRQSDSKEPASSNGSWKWQTSSVLPSSLLMHA
jgi:hypothetical protein